MADILTDEIAAEVDVYSTHSDTPPNTALAENSLLDPRDAAIEALIFSSPEPLAPGPLCEHIDGLTPREIDRAMMRLNARYENGGHAFRIRKIAGGYQYYIMPREAEFVNKLFRRERKLRLTKPSLETLAIVAYKQPISKSELEQIRGVACDGVLQTLMERDLVRIAGRSEAIGRPLLYSATPEFLKFFGIASFDDLPKLAEIEEILANMEAERAARQMELSPLLNETAEDLKYQNEAGAMPANGPDSSSATSETDNISVQ